MKDQLNYDMLEGVTLDALTNFDRESFHQAFEFGAFQGDHIFDALKVAQYGHLCGLTPWQAATNYIGQFYGGQALMRHEGFEVCEALAKFVNWDHAVQEHFPGVRRYVSPNCEGRYAYFRGVTGSGKPHIRIKAPTEEVSE